VGKIEKALWRIKYQLPLKDIRRAARGLGLVEGEDFSIKFGKEGSYYMEVVGPNASKAIADILLHKTFENDVDSWVVWAANESGLYLEKNEILVRFC
jgi:hypothetical protein